VSKETISRITDEVLEEMNEWAVRPFNETYSELGAFTAGAGPQPQDVPFPVEADPDRGVKAAVGELAHPETLTTMPSMKTV